MLKSLILAAALAGVAAGFVAAVLQHVTTTPIIIEAERYESAGHDHAAAGAWTLPEGSIVATHDGAEWAPADGLQRTLFTSLASIVIGFGFASALLGTMILARANIGARSGLAFGAAGFAAVALAPALGLPPEMPGSAAADLAGRQVWWLFTAAATAAGLACLLIGRSTALWIGGLALVLLPHLVGAPHPEAYASTAPAELAAHFAAASLVVSAVFWATLGFASGSVYERLSRPR